MVRKNLGKATLWWLAAYWSARYAGVPLSIVLALTLDLPGSELGTHLLESPAYLATQPYHPLLNMVAFLPAAYFFMRGRVSPTSGTFLPEALKLGVFWAGLSAAYDLVSWVIIPTPVQFTFRQFYVDYQPWLTLIYAVIFLSPLLAAAVMSIRPAQRTTA